MKKDYKSFSSAAKSRFRKMAIELGYDQITGITYTKKREGWYETFNLQSSSYGNPFFYINYGVILNNSFPSSREELKGSGWFMGNRISYKSHGAFPCGTKAEIESSAEYALEVYLRDIVPWFEKLDLESINKEIGDELV